MIEPTAPKRPGRFWGSLVLSALLAGAVLLFLFRQVQWEAMQTLRLRWPWLLLGLGAYLLTQFVRGWRLVLATHGARSAWRWTIVTMAQNLLLLLLPMRTGELSFVALLTRELGTGLAAAGRLVIVVRLLDLASVGLAFALACWLPGVIPSAVRAIWPLAAAASVACLLILLWPQVLVGLVRPPLRWLGERPGLRERALVTKGRGLMAQLVDLRELPWLRRALPGLLAQSLLIWGLLSVANLCYMAAVGLWLTPAQAFYVTSVIVLSGVLPIHGLASFGPLDAIGTALLMSLGHPKQVAIPTQLAWHAQTASVICGTGLLAWLLMVSRRGAPRSP